MAKQRFLIVDSDQKTLRVLEASLLKGGYSVTTSLTAADAFEKISVSPPDLIISEVVLPQMSGYEFCKKIKSAPSTRSIPFLFLTRLKSVGDKIKGLELGADDYLTKPIYLKEVLTRVKLLLEKKEKEKLEMSTTEPKFSGSLSDIGVVDLIQTLELGNKNAEVNLQRGDRKAFIYFKKGKIIDAEVGALKGEGAVYRLLNWSEGTFRVDFTDISREDKIGKSNQALVMEGMRRVDELVRIQEELPPPSSIVVIDSNAVLSDHPQQFPAKIEELMSEFDGKSTIEEVVDRTGLNELEAYEIIAKLYFQGFLVDSGQRGSQEPVIFKKPVEKPEVQDDTGISFLEPPGESDEETDRRVEAKESHQETEELTVDVESPFLNPPQGIEAKEGVVNLLGDKREKTLKTDADGPDTFDKPASPPQKDSKVIFLKPSQLAERLKPKETKVQRDFWRDEPLLSSLEKVLVNPEPAVQSELHPMEPQAPSSLPQPPLRRAPAIPQVSGVSSVPRLGRDVLPAGRQEFQAPLPQVPAPSHAPFVMKILAMVVPPVVIAGALYVGKDYILSRSSPTAGESRVSPEPGESSMERVDALMRAGKDTEALALLTKELDRDPKNSRGYYLRGLLRVKSPATIAQGLEDLRNAVVLSPKDRDATLALGMEYLKKKSIPDAVMFLKRAVELDPGLSKAYQGLGLSYSESKEYDSAVTAFRKALDLDSRDMTSRLALGKIYYETGSLEKAQDNLRIVLSQANQETNNDLTAEARKYMELIEAKSTKKPSEPMRGSDKTMAGSSQSPLRTASLAPKKTAPKQQAPPGERPSKSSDAEQAMAHHKAGKALYDEGKVKEAITEYRLAMLQAPRNAAILVDLGNALFDDGKDKDAIDVLEKAVSIDSRISRAHLSLGGIYSTKGDKDKALMHYKKFLSIEPTGTAADEVRTILKNLSGG